MNIKSMCFIGGLLISLLLTACCEKSDKEDLSHDNRTILLYMLANNNLSSLNYDNLNIQDICDAITNNDIDGKMVIYYAGLEGDPELIEIYRNKKGVAVMETIKTYPGQVSTNTSAIKEVLSDVKSMYKTQSYGLVMWSHATSWLPQNRYYAPNRHQAPTSFGREGDEALTIDIDSLRYAMEPHHFDFILFDACLMSSVEVAYELRHICDYIIASPTETLGSGYPYKEITPLLFEENIDYKQICRCYYDHFIAPGTSETGTIALIKTAALENLADKCRDIVIDKETEISKLNTRSIQHYDRNHLPFLLYDIEHYMEQIAEEDELEAFRSALDETIEYKAASLTFLNILITNYSGLSSYIPGCIDDSILEDYYTKLRWYNRVYK